MLFYNDLMDPPLCYCYGCSHLSHCVIFVLSKRRKACFRYKSVEDFISCHDFKKYPVSRFVTWKLYYSSFCNKDDRKSCKFYYEAHYGLPF